MNKKKIISSLTIAGMIASAGISNVFAADEDTATTPALGEFTGVIDGKTIIPFKLQSVTDRVTGKDLKIAYPGAYISVPDEEILKTGDVVSIDGELRTIVIYGDVNKDGEMDIYDITAIVNSVKTEKPLTGVELVAADLNGDNTADIYDLTRMVNAISNDSYASMNVKLPVEEATKVSNIEIYRDEVDYISVKYNKNSSENTYTLYDNKAKKDLPVIVWYDSVEEKAYIELIGGNRFQEADATHSDQTYTLTIKDKNGKTVSTNTFKFDPLNDIDDAVVENVKKADGTAIEDIINADNQKSLSVKVSVEVANDKDTTVIVTLRDESNKEITGTAKLAKNAIAVSVNNFKEVDTLKDGTIHVDVKILDADGNTVNEECLAHFEKNTKSYKIVNIEAQRRGDALAEEPIVEIDNPVGNQTVYYLAKKATESAPKVDEIISDEDNKDYQNVKFEENVEYTLYVVAINDDLGVKSEVASTKISKATAVPLNSVEPATVTDNDGEFKWEDSNNEKSKVKGYKVVLYNVNRQTETAITTKTVTEKSINLLKEIKEYVAENKDANQFAIKVIALAAKDSNQNSNLSEISQIYTTNALLNPRIISFTNYSEEIKDETSNHQKLAWDAVAEASMYQINIYKYDKVDDELPAEKAIKTIKTASTTREYDLTNALSSLSEGRYSVKVLALASSDSKYVDSNEEDDDIDVIDVFNLKAPTDLKLVSKGISDGSVKVEATYSDIIDNDKVPYIIYELYYGEKPISGEIQYGNDNISTEKNKALHVDTITGLGFDKTYNMFVVVRDEYSGVEISRSKVSSIKTQKEQVEINGLTYVSTDGRTEIAEGQISVDGNKLLVGTNNGMVTCESNNDYAKYSVVLPIVKALAEGDKIFVNEEKDEIYVESYAVAHDYGKALENVNLVKVLGENATIAGTFKKIEIGEDIENTDLSNANVKDKVIAGNSNVKVQSGTKVETLGGKINNILVNAEATVTAVSKGLEIDGKVNDVYVTITEDIKDDTTLKFVGTDVKRVAIDNSSYNNKVTTVTSEYPIEGRVDNGIVDVTDFTFTRLTIINDGKVKTTKAKTLKADSFLPDNEVIINPTSGGTVIIDANNKISGNATITIKDVEGVKKEDKVQTIDSADGERIDDSNIVIGNLNGSTKYTVIEDDGDIIITSTGDTIVVDID